MKWVTIDEATLQSPPHPGWWGLGGPELLLTARSQPGRASSCWGSSVPPAGACVPWAGGCSSCPRWLRSAVLRSIFFQVAVI